MTTSTTQINPGHPGSLLPTAPAQGNPFMSMTQPMPRGPMPVIPMGLAAALQRMQAFRPDVFARMGARPMGPAMGFGQRGIPALPTQAAAPAQQNAMIGMARPAMQPQPQFGGFAPPMFDHAQAAAQSQMGMERSQSKNQNIGSMPPY